MFSITTSCFRTCAGIKRKRKNSVKTVHTQVSRKESSKKLTDMQKNSPSSLMIVVCAIVSLHHGHKILRLGDI